MTSEKSPVNTEPEEDVPSDSKTQDGGIRDYIVSGYTAKNW
jgi:hypothetical protein